MANLQVFWWMVLWGSVVLASWVGWGTLVAKAVRLRRGIPIDWGLRAAWGMALTLAMGGFLLLFRLATAPVMQVLVLAGAVIWGVDFYTRLRGPQKTAPPSKHAPRSHLHPPSLHRRPHSWLWHLPVLIVAILIFLGSIESVRLSWWDDYPAYIHFVRKMLATGTLLEPFSWRRLSTYGGHFFLQAQVMSVGPDLSAFMVDQGLSAFVLWGLIVGMFARNRKHLWMLLVVAFLALWIEVPRINSQSQLSGAVLFLAIYRTFRMQRLGDPQSQHIPWILGMLASGLATLRMNFLPVAGLVLVLAFLGAAATDRRHWKIHALRTAIPVGIMLLLLVPWAIVLYQSSGSLFYPLMPGNQRPEFAALLSAPWSFLQKLQWTALFLVQWKVVLLTVPLLLVLRRRHWRDILPLYLASVAGAVAIAWSFTMSDNRSLYRYAFPFLFPSAMIAFAWGLQHWRFRKQAIAAGAMVAALLVMNAEPAIRKRNTEFEMFRLNQAEGVSLTLDSTYRAYRTAQEAVPKGARILSFLPQPTLLDYERNDILIADMVSVACPDPGMPLSEGPEPFRRYLKSQGIDYILAPDFDNAVGLYDRPYYARIRDHPEDAAEFPRTDVVFAAPHATALDLVNALARTPRLVNPGQTIRVIQISP